jgi:hypothetical protein
MKVAQYEVLGRFFSKATRPASARDDRSAACAREAVYASQGQRVRSSLPEGAIFYAFSHYRGGLLSNVPAGPARSAGRASSARDNFDYRSTKKAALKGRLQVHRET